MVDNATKWNLENLNNIGIRKVIYIFGVFVWYKLKVGLEYQSPTIAF